MVGAWVGNGGRATRARTGGVLILLDNNISDSDRSWSRSCNLILLNEIRLGKRDRLNNHPGTGMESGCWGDSEQKSY